MSGSVCVLEGLLEEAQEVVLRGAAWATHSRWSSTQRKFLYFCSISGVKVAVPCSAMLLILYCTWLVRCGHPESSIMQYVDGVRVLNESVGHTHPWAEYDYVARRFKRGLKQLCGKAPLEKLALGGSLVHRLVYACKRDWCGMRMAGVLVVAYVMACRIGHLVPCNARAVHLIRCKHVVVWKVRGMVMKVKVTLPSTKTSRWPIDIWVHRCEEVDTKWLQAVEWLAWFRDAGIVYGEETPLVRLVAVGAKAHKPWYRSGFNKELERMLRGVGVDASRYSGISLRKGCLSDLAVAGRSPLALATHATHKSMNSQMSYVKADEALMMQNGKVLSLCLRA